MNSRLLLVFCAILLFHGIAHATQSSTITEEGYACMGDGKSKQQTEQLAVANAKRNAIEKAYMYIPSNIQLRNFNIEHDLMKDTDEDVIDKYEELEKGWYRDPTTGDCYRVKIKADVVLGKKRR